MADILHDEVVRYRGISAGIGQQMLEIITSGMYDNPLMIYREYVQNAVDSIDSAIKAGTQTIEESCIEIRIDGRTKTAVIEDNGIGVNNEEVESVLGSLGLSSKGGLQQRGFRGIGRLGGLSYCDLLRFETRSHHNEKIAVVEWDNRIFEIIIRKSGKPRSIREAVSEISSIHFREPRISDSDHFFRVELINIRPFHNNLLINPTEVRNYLSQIAPVPFNREAFSFADELDEFLSVLPGYRSYNILLDGDTVYKAINNEFPISESSIDTIRGIEHFEWTNSNGKCIARGWFANTSLLGSLPAKVLERGIRVRQGNIEVGDEYFLSDFFTERRFSTWHIGEVHVLDNCIKQNARRDGFEQSEEYECFLEHSYFLGRYLSNLCRKASIERNKHQRLERLLDTLDSELEKDQIYIDHEDYRNHMVLLETKLKECENLLGSNCTNDSKHIRFREISLRLESKSQSPKFLMDVIDGRSLRHKGHKELLVQLCHRISEVYTSCSSSADLIEEIVRPYFKTSSRNDT